MLTPKRRPNFEVMAANEAPAAATSRRGMSLTLLYYKLARPESRAQAPSGAALVWPPSPAFPARPATPIAPRLARR
ncbi:MAG TPA: hypothetical protein ENK23_00700 [Sorangium sp.]|nr:hypothetical protein [Sorangium sp.]